VLKMDKQNYLSNLSEYEGMSLRAIAKRSGHHFNTVKKYVDKAMSKLDDYLSNVG